MANEKKKQSENIDFMFASKTCLLFWMTFLAPLLISYSMKLIYKDRIAKDDIYSINVFHEVLTLI